jgi:hypothetical protein
MKVTFDVEPNSMFEYSRAVWSKEDSFLKDFFPGETNNFPNNIASGRKFSTMLVTADDVWSQCGNRGKKSF